MNRGGMSLARQVFALQLAVLVVVILLGGALAVLDARHDSDEATRHEVTDVAVTLAQAPSTAAAVATDDPTALLQPQTESIRQQTGMDFIVVMAPDRTRYTHTDPTQIGKPFSGNIDRALAGETFTETYTGTLGPSIRSVTPVYGTDGEIVGPRLRGRDPDQDRRGGRGTTAADPRGGRHRPAAGAWSVAAAQRRLRRQTHGMAPGICARMFEHHEAVLHSIREGLIVFDGDAATPFGDGVADVVNDEARRLLDLPPEGPLRGSSAGVTAAHRRRVARRDARDADSGARGQPGGGAVRGPR